MKRFGWLAASVLGLLLGCDGPTPGRGISTDVGPASDVALSPDTDVPADGRPTSDTSMPLDAGVAVTDGGTREDIAALPDVPADTGTVCGTGMTLCAGACVDTLTDALHCGSCERACPTTQACAAGACACAGGGTLCGSACVATATDVANCGACGHVCAAPSHGTATCADGACGVICTANFGDCNHVGGDGCEVDLRIDLTHCGACGHSCAAVAHATATCAAGACGFTCDVGYVALAGTCVPSPPRPVAPLSTATVTTRRPTLRWVLPGGASGAHVQLCRDRAMTSGCMAFDATGDHGAPSTDLPRGVTFWTVSQSGSGTGAPSSPVWQFVVGARSAPVDTSWGTVADFNGDGYADLVLGVALAGTVHIHPGSASGVSTTATILHAPGDSHAFGAAVASGGDLNGDGYADLVVGGPNAVDGPSGQVYVYRGGAAGLNSTPMTTLVSSPPGFVYSGLGEFVASAGDVNGDGYADLAAGDGRGVLIYLGGASGPSPTPSVLSDLSPATHFGSPFGSVGDVNGDGYADFFVGASGWIRGGAPDPGHVFVYLGSAVGLNTFPTTTLSEADDLFGQRTAIADDVNGDGYADLVSGSQYGNTVYVYLGGRTGLSTTSTRLTGPSRTFNFGDSVASAGDTNGDGYADLVVEDPGYGGSYDGGHAFVCLGGPTGLSALPATAPGPSNNGVGVGDLNGDGFADFAVVGSVDSWVTVSIFVYFGGATGLGTPPTILSAPNGFFGGPLAWAPATSRSPPRRVA